MVGDKLLEKLWDTLTKEGIGALVAPWQTRRKGRANVDARRDELLMLAQTEVDVADIKAGKKKFTEDRQLVEIVQPCVDISGFNLTENRIEPIFSIEQIRNSSYMTQQARELQKQINVTKAALFAEEELENNYVEGSDQDVDPDWFERWRENVEKVSSEDLQRLWAKALAGEIVTPGTFSLRTLDFIKNLSKDEAYQISRLAPFAIDGKVFKVSAIDHAGLTFSYLLEMEELGIISSANSLGFDIKSNNNHSYESVLACNNKCLFITHENSRKIATFESLKVTSLGCEVFKLGQFLVDIDYFKQVGLKAKNQGFKVFLADWSPLNDFDGYITNKYEL